MGHEVPPIIEAPKTVIGVGLRELLLLTVFGVAALLALLLPLPLPLRIGISVLLALFGLTWAFGRDRRSGKPIEAILLDRVRFLSQVRFWQRGAGAGEESVLAPPLMHEPEEDLRRSTTEPLLQVPAIPITAMVWFEILSLAVLASFLSWAWLGGMRELLLWFQPGFAR